MTLTLYPHWTIRLENGWKDNSAAGAIFWRDVGTHSAWPSQCIMGVMVNIVCTLIIVVHCGIEWVHLIMSTISARRYTGSYRIPVFIFLTIWILKIPQYRYYLNNVWNATLLERGLFSQLHFGEDTAVCVTKRESSETEALVECDEREEVHPQYPHRPPQYPTSAASAPASLTN